MVIQKSWVQLLVFYISYVLGNVTARLKQIYMLINLQVRQLSLESRKRFPGKQKVSLGPKKCSTAQESTLLFKFLMLPEICKGCTDFLRYTHFARSA
jgi:hypothetical protein